MIQHPVLLTGAANGIGRATAFALAGRGYPLGLIDRDPVALEQVAASLREGGHKAEFACVDVTDREALQTAADRLQSSLGTFRTLVACAGIGRLTQVPDLDLAGFRTMLEVNVLGVANAIDVVLPGMIAAKGGHIVGLSSVAGFRGLPWMASYSASKAALSAYLEGLRPALKRRGVTITTVCPGFVRTAITKDTPFRKPVRMMEPEDAARHLVRAVEKKPRNHVFPLGTAMGLTFLKYIPDRMFDWIMDRAGPKALTTDF